VGLPGRALNSARTNHFIVDSSSGPNEALNSVEAFLAGISSCGVTLVERQARQDGIPLQKLAVTIQGRRNAADTARFESVNLRFELFGVTQDQAEQLVEAYKRR
jgi:uncharacterized OsmC-like protein